MYQLSISIMDNFAERKILFLFYSFVELYYSAYPVEGTRTGYRYPYQEVTPRSLATLNGICTQYATRVLSYDHLMNIASNDQISRYIERVKSLLAEVEEVENGSLSVDQGVDREIIISQLNLELVKWLEVKYYEKDPSLYLTFDAINYLLPSWGPEREKGTSAGLSHPGVASLSVTYRMTALLSRLRQIPLVLQTGIENLSRPVQQLIERAIKLCDSFRVFLKLHLPQLVQGLSQDNPTLVNEVVESALVASEAVTRYKELLGSAVLTKASDTYLSVGKSVYDKLLKFGHFINDSSSLLELGEKQFVLVKGQLEQLAGEIDPHRTWLEITEDIIRPLHPSAQELLPSYLSEIERARDHMIQLDLVPSLPEGEQVLGFYTPQFLVPFSPFGDFLNPSPFASQTLPPVSSSSSTTSIRHQSLTGYLMLHSVAAKGLTPREEENLLRSHDYSWISVIAPHECYPGHHVQALLAQQHPRILRKFYVSTYFYEGWGLYCEQLAYETGFFQKEISKECCVSENRMTVSSGRFAQVSRLTQLRLQLWRAARVILDIKLHRNEMSIEECRSFLCREVMFDPLSVDGEVFVYVSIPTYAPCYVAGYVELMRLREEERKRCVKERKEFNLKIFHKKLLQTGCIPFPFIKEIMKSY